MLTTDDRILFSVVFFPEINEASLWIAAALGRKMYLKRQKAFPSGAQTEFYLHKWSNSHLHDDVKPLIEFSKKAKKVE